MKAGGDTIPSQALETRSSQLPDTFPVAVENIHSLLADVLSAGFQIPVITFNYRQRRQRKTTLGIQGAE